jgi:hypothetical protein
LVDGEAVLGPVLDVLFIGVDEGFDWLLLVPQRGASPIDRDDKKDALECLQGLKSIYGRAPREERNPVGARNTGFCSSLPQPRNSAS